MKDMRHFLRRTKSIVRRGLVNRELTAKLDTLLSEIWRDLHLRHVNLRRSQLMSHDG